MFKKVSIAIIASIMLLAPATSFAGRGGGAGGRGGAAGGRGGFGNAGGGRAGFGGTSSGGTSSIIGADDAEIVLIPSPETNQIIARAPAEVLRMIEMWINEFDLEDTEVTEYDRINVNYVDVEEVADQLNEIMVDLIINFQRNVSILPLPSSRQILVFGKKEHRDLVKTILKDIDIPSNQLLLKIFYLRYADPADIKEKIDELYSMSGTTGTTTTRGITGGTTTGALSADTVITTTYPSLRQLVVQASEDNLNRIAALIEEWDTKFVWDEVKPRVIPIKNVDPVQMVELLTSLFSSSGSTGGSSNVSQNTRQMLSASYSTTADVQETIIGPLYGKLTFWEIPGTKRIIVASSVPDAYDIVEDLIKEIDSEELPVIPVVIQLKYADSEDLAQRLNTIFAEAGQSTSIRMSETGLGTESAMDYATTDSTETDDYTPPWSSGGSAAEDEAETTALFGKVRFMPEPNTKSILMLTPEQYRDELEELITILDVSGKQVLIETAILEIEQSILSSLGVEFSSAAVGPAGTYGVTTNATYSNGAVTDSSGSISYPYLISQPDFQMGSLTANILVDFLVNEGNAKILNQQTLWTKDNKEASFFKGQTIPIKTGSTSTTNQSGNLITEDTYERQSIGMEVRVRPTITPENNVTMVVNVNYAQVSGRDEISDITVTSDMTTTTSMIVQDGETLILGGILFQTDTIDTNKIPLLGDIPIAGQLFRHDEIKKTNNELMIFLTPHVINENPEDLDQLIEETKRVINDPKIKFDQIVEELQESIENIKE